MAITTSNFETGVFSNCEYEQRQKHFQESNKLYRFTYMLGSDQYKSGIIAPNEREAALLFDLLAAENGGDIRVENQEMMGVVDFMTPNLHKVYKKKLSMAVHDKFYSVLRQDKEIREKAAKAEVDKRQAEKAKKKEQQTSHMLNVLAQAAAYARKFGFAKEQREAENDKNFSEWMKIKQ
jgi:hypothetical protein